MAVIVCEPERPVPDTAIVKVPLLTLLAVVAVVARVARVAKVAKVAKVKKPRVTKAGKGKKSARMRAIWVVLSNNATKVASYEFSKEKEARDHAERLMTEKKQVHFVQMVKEEMTEPA